MAPGESQRPAGVTAELLTRCPVGTNMRAGTFATPGRATRDQTRLLTYVLFRPRGLVDKVSDV